MTYHFVVVLDGVVADTGEDGTTISLFSTG
jgi:hypothetical protein